VEYDLCCEKESRQAAASGENEKVQSKTVGRRLQGPNLVELGMRILSKKGSDNRLTRHGRGGEKKRSRFNEILSMVMFH